MKKRFLNRAVCSSANFSKSRDARVASFQEEGSHYNHMTVKGELSIDIPTKTGRFKTIRVFGREMQVTIEEYNIHCKELGL